MHAYIYSLSDGSFIFTYTYIINELKAYKFVSYIYEKLRWKIVK